MTRAELLLRRRWPELLLVALGVFLRWKMLRGYHVSWGYDYGAHIPYIEWFRQHWSLPELGFSRETYHPPLYYLLAGGLERLGVKLESLGWIGFVCGCLRLGLIWLGLELYLPRPRLGACHGPLARRVGLALAVVLPASLMVDGMLSGETLSSLFTTGALVLAPVVFRAQDWRRWTAAAGLGLTFALALLTKISALVLVGAVGIAALAELAWSSGNPLERLRRFAPFAAGLAVLLAASGWYFVNNHRATGKYFLTGFDGPDKWHITPTLEATPYLDRRPLGFFIGWTNDIFDKPYYPSGTDPNPRLAPILIATTFSDYFNYRFAPPPPPGSAATVVNTRPLRAKAISLARLSVIGGTLIAIATLAAWVAAWRAVWRRREAERLVLLLAPLLGLIGALHFATKYPLDHEGVIKGSYLQFATGPLFGLFGLAVERTWSSWRTRAIAALLLAALALVAAYTVYCRLV